MEEYEDDEPQGSVAAGDQVQGRATAANGGDGAVGDNTAAKRPKRAISTRAKRPKLSIDDLTKPDGLANVFHNFPKWFGNGFKGKGHEVRDLRRLLELYQRWQLRVFPHCSFDAFVEGLEKLSGKMAVRMELRELRQGLFKVVDGDEPAAGDAEQDGDAACAQHGTEAAPAGIGAADSPGGAHRAAAPAQPAGTGTPAAAGVSVQPLAAGSVGMRGAAAQGASPAAEDGIEDDEFLELQAHADWDAAEDALGVFDGNAPLVRQDAAGAGSTAAASEVAPAASPGRGGEPTAASPATASRPAEAAAASAPPSLPGQGAGSSHAGGHAPTPPSPGALAPPPWAASGGGGGAHADEQLEDAELLLLAGTEAVP